MTASDGNMNLRRFDLNLLPILKALLTTHSVARSSEILGLSQSATSGALTRLRVTFGDPLLVQVGRNLVPTPRAQALVPILQQAFQELHAVFDQRTFDPREEERRFVICTSDYAIDELGLPLIKLLATEAPRVSVTFVEVSMQHRTSMIGGDIDFMITPQNLMEAGSEDFQSKPLSEHQMVVVSSASFPVPDTGLDLECYLGAKHAAYGANGSETFQQWVLRERGLRQNNLIVIPQFTHLPRYVAGSHCLAMMPEHVAKRLSDQYGLRIWPAPFDMPKLKMALHWSHVLDVSPAHRWFRDIIVRAWQTALARD